MKNFNFEEKKIVAEIKKHDAKRVLLQLPEGLKSEGPRLAKVIEKIGVLPLISGDPCYGACDIADFYSERFKIDLIIHFGHTRMIRTEKIPTIYVTVQSTLKISKALQASLSLLKNYQRIGLVTTVQHIQTLKFAKDLLVASGKTVLIGTSKTLPFSGQIIGCDYGAVKSIANDVEAFLFIGGGRFHALGVALSTMKPTVIANPFDQEAYLLDDQVNKLLQQNWNSIQIAKKAELFGILVGLKPGQEKFENALKIKKLIERKGKQTILLLINEIVPEALIEFPTIDAYVNTACPRISIEAPIKFLKPVLTINELKVLFGEYSWKDLIKKGLFGK